jgi:UDP-N-acetylglucosamine 3-dehydrogenase
MGTAHADPYARFKDVKVIGVFSRNQERAEAVARICGAKSVNDAFALLDDPTIAIDVCVPSANHREFVVAALQRGKHVFCETPFALQLRDAEVMIEAARHSGHILLVGLLVRSIAHYEHVHRVAASGRLGKILSVTAYRLGSYLRSEGPGRKEYYADPTTELMTFDFDFVQWLLGRPASISATAAKTESGSPRPIGKWVG